MKPCTGIYSALLFFCILVCFNQAQAKEPSVSITNVAIASLSQDHVALNVSLNINNPNTFTLTINSYEYNLAIDEKFTFTGDSADKISIPAQQEKLITVPVLVPYATVSDLIQHQANADALAYKLDVKVIVAAPLLGAIPFNISKEDSFTLPKYPELSIQTIDIVGMSFTGATAELGVQIKNPNPFALSITALKYRLSVDGKPWADGQIYRKIEAKSGQSARAKLPVTVNLQTAGPGIIGIMQKGSLDSYRLEGTVTASTDLPYLKEVTLPFDISY